MISVVLVGEYWAIGVAGLALGVAAGWLAGRASERRAHGPRERAYVARNCRLSGLLMGAFVASAAVLPSPSRFIVPALLMFVLPALVYRWSVRRQILRKLEERDATRHPPYV